MLYYDAYITLLGCGQVVRHMVLVHAFGGSNPSTPAKKIDVGLKAYVNFLCAREVRDSNGTASTAVPGTTRPTVAAVASPSTT